MRLPLALLLGSLALASVAVADFSPASAGGDGVQADEGLLGVSGAIFPRKLPRTRMVPAGLRLGFTSATANTTAIPELASIQLKVYRNLAFQTAGLPSCPIAELYSEYSDAAQICARSLVGYGTVTSEVTVPGQAPMTIEGLLSAFYDFGEGQPRILAQVTSTGPLPLTYVIPFTIDKGYGLFGAILSVQQMRLIEGICRRGRSNCFSQPYTYKGIYGRISKFELTLDRQFIHAGKMTSFVSADCPAGEGSSSAILPVVKVELTYSTAIMSQSQVATSRCEVAASRRRRGHA
jgi:hypothetical protein